MKYPRLTKIFSADDFVVYIVDSFFVRNNLSVDFCLGGHFFRYPFIPQNEIWIEPVQNRLDQEMNTAHECVERYMMKVLKYNYNFAHAKAAKFEEKIRKAKVQNPIQVALNVCELISKRKLLP
jgi:hypothetical protein